MTNKAMISESAAAPRARTKKVDGTRHGDDAHPHQPQLKPETDEKRTGSRRDADEASKRNPT